MDARAPFGADPEATQSRSANPAGSREATEVPRSPELSGYSFGSWEIDPSRRRRLRDGAEAALRPKVFDLLLHFVHRPGRSVRREELLASVWPGVNVCETTLATTIHELRTILARDADGHVRLRTAHTRGFVFEANVTEGPSRPTPASPARCGDFVGRRRLLAEIEEAFDAAQRGFGVAFVPVGEAGIGKSRMLGIGNGSLAAENRLRRQHMERALDRLAESVEQLGIRRNALRKEAIVEEIEVILSAARILVPTRK